MSGKPTGARQSLLVNVVLAAVVTLALVAGLEGVSRWRESATAPAGRPVRSASPIAGSGGPIVPIRCCSGSA